jgi:hypothetical protein
MLFNNPYEDEEIQEEAREVARKTMQMDDWQAYVEGAAFRIIKLEREVSRLRFNFLLLIFFIFGLPIMFRILGIG